MAKVTILRPNMPSPVLALERGRLAQLLGALLRRAIRKNTSGGDFTITFSTEAEADAFAELLTDFGLKSGKR